MIMSRERICYEALMLVYRDGAYSSHALSQALSSNRNDSELVTRLFYGVLEKDVTLSYVIGRIAAKRPKLPVMTVLKIGTYMMRYMSVPDYAAVDGCVELVKSLGKGGVASFVNAVLRKAKEVSLPKRGEVSDVEYISVNFGLPEWLAEKFEKQYGTDFTCDMMSAEEFRTHIRLRKGFDVDKFEKSLAKLEDLPKSKTKYGYYVTHNTLNQLIKGGNLGQTDFAVQSLASIAAANVYCDGLTERSSVLDLCAAPGGKIVYVAENIGCKPIACDIHPHRLELIRSYAKRVGAEVEVVLNDACVERGEWAEAFDCVICDVPCSGTGDLRSKPDVLLNKSPEKIAELAKLQAKILRRASGYVKVGGKLCYSTCSALKEENEDIIDSFVRHNTLFSVRDCSEVASKLCVNGAESGFNKGPYMKLFPQLHKTDGFFAAVLEKRAVKEECGQ